MKKKLAIGCGFVVLLLIAAFVIFSLWFDHMINDNLSKKEIFDLVNENYGVILTDIEEKEFSNTEKLEGVKDVYHENETIEVYCGGRGLGSETSYFGFYYSSDNLPKTPWCGTNFDDEKKLQPDENGFLIEYINNDNFYYTEKIRDHFYYYEAHF